MNRHDFIRLTVAGFGTMLASGAAINFLSNKIRLKRMCLPLKQHSSQHQTANSASLSLRAVRIETA